MKLLRTDKIIQKYVGIWLAYWFLVMGVNLFILKPLGYDYLNESEFISSFFLVFSFLGYYLFDLVGDTPPVANPKKQIVLTLLSLVVFYWVSKWVAYCLPLADEPLQLMMERAFYYPLLLPNTIIAKLTDIIFQQMMIISMVLFLKKNCKSSREVVGTFTFIFFLLHLPLFLHFGLFSLTFIIPSLFAGAIFSFCITNFSWGILVSVLVHQAFYISMAILLRLSII